MVSITVMYDIEILRIFTNLALKVFVLEASRTVLRFVDLEVISNEKCISYEDYVPYIVDQHLCTSGRFEFEFE